MNQLGLDEILERGAPRVSVPPSAGDTAAEFVRDVVPSRLRRRRSMLLGVGIAGVLSFGATTAAAVSGVPTHLGWFATVATEQQTSTGAVCDNGIRAVPATNAEVAEYASFEEKQRVTDRANELLAALDLASLDIRAEVERIEADVATGSENAEFVMNANGIETFALFNVAVQQVQAQLESEGLDQNLTTFDGAADCSGAAMLDEK